MSKHQIQHSHSYPTILNGFRALNTAIEYGFRTDEDSGNRLHKQLYHMVIDFEQQYSRFLPNSELSRINTAAGDSVTISRSMLRLLEVAKRAWRETDGIVDPTIGYALIAAGYDRSFELLPQLRALSPSAPTIPPRASFADVRIDKERQTVCLPAGVCLDFGGIGKGYVLDSIIPMVERVTANYWLSFGGDVVISGTAEDGQTWPVAVQNPHSPREDMAYIRSPGKWSIATSGIIKRRGVVDGRPWHHLIDPETQRPASNNVVAVTALATSALDADVSAKTILIRGAAAGLQWARQREDLEALVITAQGHILMTPGMQTIITFV